MSTWDNAPLICYGDDGPAFVRLCPQCSRFMKWPKVLEYEVNGLDQCRFPKITCSKCGPVKPHHVGWTGDFT